VAEPKFDDVLDVWVAKQNAWTLFDAVCLLRHIDPDKRQEPILLEVDDGRTTRYFKYSLEGAGTYKNYKILKENPNEVGAKQYRVDGKAFIEWAIKRWPDEALHLKDALLRYKSKKGTLSKTQRERYVRELAHKNVFDEFVEQRSRATVAVMSAHEIYRQIAPMIEKKIAVPLQERKVRDLISRWKHRP
jgi:hypothetical protein